MLIGVSVNPEKLKRFRELVVVSYITPGYLTANLSNVQSYISTTGTSVLVGNGALCSINPVFR